MKSTLLNIDLAHTFPTTAAVAKDYLALDFKLSTIADSITGNITEHMHLETPVSKDSTANHIKEATTEHPHGALVLLQYYGVNVDRFVSIGAPQNSLLQIACRALGEVANGYKLNTYNKTAHAALLPRLVCTSENTIPTDPECVYSARRLVTVFGYLLLRATQLRMENMGTAPSTTRNRLQTVADILGHYVDDFQIKINDGNWRELLMVYLSNAVD